MADNIIFNSKVSAEGFTVNGTDINNLYATKKELEDIVAAGGDGNTKYELTKSGSTITLTGSDGTTTSVTDNDTHVEVIDSISSAETTKAASANATKIAYDTAVSAKQAAAAAQATANSKATTTYVDNAVASMVDSAPDTLNTLNELAAALGDDPNFATTVANQIGGKVSKSGDTMTGRLQVNAPIFGYNYLNGSQSAAAFVFDKPGYNFTGIGANGENDTIYFGAVSNADSGTWNNEYKQKWKFNGDVIADNLVVKRSSDGTAYRDLGTYYNSGSADAYIKISFPSVPSWTMLTMELTIRQDYGSGKSGKLIIYANQSEGNVWRNFYAVTSGRLDSVIHVYGSDRQHIYVSGIADWGGLSVDRMLIGDSAVSSDLTDISITEVSSLPETYQTAAMSSTITSETIGSQSVSSASTATVATALGRDGDTNKPMTFNWSGQSGQPAWLWGGSDSDPDNMYVYGPSNFNVNSAVHDGNGNTIASTYLPLSGGTMTGSLVFKVNDYGGHAIGNWFSNNDGTAYGALGAFANDGVVNKLFIGFGDSPWGGNGLDLTPNSIQWQGNALIHAGNIGSQTVYNSAHAVRDQHGNVIDSTYVFKSGDTMRGALLFSTDVGKISFGGSGLPIIGGAQIATGNLAIGANGIGISGTLTRNDGAGIFLENGGSEEANKLVIALGDDSANTGSDGDGICFRYYDTAGNATYESKIPFKSGTIALTSDIPTSLPASDVYSWAKASSKPSYSWNEIGSRPTALSQFTNDKGFLTYNGTIEYADWAHGVAWADVAGSPYRLSEFTNDSGFITSSGTCAGLSAVSDDMYISNTNDGIIYIQASSTMGFDGIVFENGDGRSVSLQEILDYLGI